MTSAQNINNWLCGQGRLLGNGGEIVTEYVQRLLEAGVPVSRVRVGQRLANPIIAAWGVIWTPQGVKDYTVPRIALDTTTWIGSPFQYVSDKRRPLRKSLADLDRRFDHDIYHELAAAGGTDFFAMPLEYGDGSVQGCSFVTQSPAGFRRSDLALIESTRNALAAALEPVAMRRSMDSLLTTYLGIGPAKAVINGTILRGEHETLQAVIMFSDMRGFTQKSAAWSEDVLLEALNEVFTVVVDAVHAQDGEVLKFIGDGVLSIFPVGQNFAVEKRCEDAICVARQVVSTMSALNEARRSADKQELAIGIGINLGVVTYGNLGSPDRLDFTVIGSSVNIASRIQDMCKVLGEPVLVSSAVAQFAGDELVSKGDHALKDVSEELELFGLEH